MSFSSQSLWAKRRRRELSQRYCSLALLSLLVAGCGDGSPPKYPASGSVTFNGQPIPDGSIAFVPQDGRSKPSATQIVDGKYAVELIAGGQKVIVEASKFVGPEDKVMGLRPRDQYLPDRYNIETTLAVDVKPEAENQFNFDLED
ncbi:MAG: hypothetical protein WD851_15895 [Pirellulales bacterium]